MDGLDVAAWLAAAALIWHAAALLVIDLLTGGPER